MPGILMFMPPGMPGKVIFLYPEGTSKRASGWSPILISLYSMLQLPSTAAVFTGKLTI